MESDIIMTWFCREGKEDSPHAWYQNKEDCLRFACEYEEHLMVKLTVKVEINR